MIYATTWFRRLRTKAPGNWKVVEASQMPTLIRHITVNLKAEIPEPGVMIRGNTMSSHYDYLYVQTPLPLELIEGLEEV